MFTDTKCNQHTSNLSARPADAAAQTSAASQSSETGTCPAYRYASPSRKSCVSNEKITAGRTNEVQRGSEKQRNGDAHLSEELQF